MSKFAFGALHDTEKHRLCVGLLTEFGARNVRESGDELIHSCPLPFGMHRNGDQNPSASLNWRKLTFHCLGCGSGGGLLWFIAIMRGTGGTDARRWLGEQTGIGGVQDLSALMDFLDALTTTTIVGAEPIPRYDRRILEPWLVIHPYLTEMRGIPEANVVRHTVGFDGESIIIPHFWQNDLVGWQARRLLASAGPKYKSTPSFPRDRTLYNHLPRERVIVVESPMSVVARSHQAHLEATFGASVTSRQMDLIAQHPEIVLWFDNDDAGWNATETVGSWLMERTSKLWVVDNPFAADPADFDDATFDDISQRCLVPFVLWKRPRHLDQWSRKDHHGSDEVRHG